MRGLVVVTAVLLLGGIFSLGTRLYEETTRPVAIVVAAETAVTGTPNAQAPAQFSLHSGTAVHIFFPPRTERFCMAGSFQGRPENHLFFSVTEMPATSPTE
jgi:hypothetical protein